MIASIRSGDGPVLIEARVVRIDPHSSSDDQRNYRTEEDIQQTLHPDPLARMENRLLACGVLTKTEVEEVRQQIKIEVDEAAGGADAQPEPGGTGLMDHIYAATPQNRQERLPEYLSSEPVAFIDAINHGLREELESNPKIQCGARTLPIRKVVFSA